MLLEKPVAKFKSKEGNCRADWPSAMPGAKLVPESVSYISPLRSPLTENISYTYSRRKEKIIRNHLASSHTMDPDEPSTPETSSDDPSVLGTAGRWDTSPSSSSSTLPVSVLSVLLREPLAYTV